MPVTVVDLFTYPTRFSVMTICFTRLKALYLLMAYADILARKLLIEEFCCRSVMPPSATPEPPPNHPWCIATIAENPETGSDSRTHAHIPASVLMRRTENIRGQNKFPSVLCDC
ncbi:hypothetical protein J6590_011514 [Homalodisca vitripennis]|nr:hypothetical protein J6590_011514 [Homalodisca vitripennis]